jgi:hypothetical protein
LCVSVLLLLQAWTEQAQEEDADVDAEPSDGGEWGDLSDSEDESSSSSSSQTEPSSTQQGDSISLAPTSTYTTAEDSSSSSDGNGSSSSDGGSSSDSNSSSDGSEAGLFGDPSISIPPRLPLPLRRNKRRQDGKVSHAVVCAVISGCPQLWCHTIGCLQTKLPYIRPSASNHHYHPLMALLWRVSSPATTRQTPRSPAQPKAKAQQQQQQSSSGAQRRARPPGPSQILYIQMEFCPRTLAQVGRERMAALLVQAGVGRKGDAGTT